MSVVALGVMATGVDLLKLLSVADAQFRMYDKHIQTALLKRCLKSSSKRLWKQSRQMLGSSSNSMLQWMLMPLWRLPRMRVS